MRLPSMASDSEKLVCSGEEPEAPSPSLSAWPRVAAELIRVLPRAMEELGLEWMALEEPAPGLFDEWFFHQPSSRQRPAPFMPPIHDKLTKTWRALYSACVKPSTAAALTTCWCRRREGVHLAPRPAQPCIRCRCFRCFRPNFSRTWTSLGGILTPSLSCAQQWTWPCALPRQPLNRSARPWPIWWCWSATYGSNWWRSGMQRKWPSSTPSLAQGTVQACRGQVHGAFHWGSKDVASAASFSAQVPQLSSCCKSHQDCIHSAIHQVGAASAPTKARAWASTAPLGGQEVYLPEAPRSSPSCSARPGASEAILIREFKLFGLSSVRQRWTSLPQKTTITAQFISQNNRMLWPTTGPTHVYMLSSDRHATPDYQVSHGDRMRSPPCGHTLENTDMVSGVDSAAVCGPIANSTSRSENTAPARDQCQSACVCVTCNL